VTSCALVTEENAEPGEGATFCAIWSALPILSVCSPLTSMASGSPLMLPTMMRPPTSLRRRRLLGRSQEAVCEGDGEGERLADFLGHRRCQRSPGESRPRIASLLEPMQPRSKRVAAPLSVLQRSHASALLPGAPACRRWTRWPARVRRGRQFAWHATAGSPPRDFARWPLAARMGASAVGSQVALAAGHASSKWYRATGLPSCSYMTRLPPTIRHSSSSKSS
jgi:hypothetical protein